MNRKLTVSVIEQLPKEKTAVIATSEVAFFPHFFRPAQPTSTDAAATDMEEREQQTNVDLRQTMPLAVTAAAGKGAAESMPEVEVHIHLSKPIVDMATLENGNILTIKVDDMRGLPEDWSLKEGSEKDPSTSTSYIMCLLQLILL